MKKQRIITLFFIVFCVVLSAGVNGNSFFGGSEIEEESIDIDSLTPGLHRIYFAGGCFWGTEHFFDQVHGVIKTKVGYANGTFQNPSYQQVITGRTGAVETVQVDFDPETVSLGLLIDLYLKTVDPTSLNRQGNDIGTQYRTGIYYVDEADKEIIKRKLDQLSNYYADSIVVELSRLKNFYIAENYHQKYLDKNPNGYCHISQDLFEYAKKANLKK